jgi:hypothetical protein
LRDARPQWKIIITTQKGESKVKALARILAMVIMMVAFCVVTAQDKKQEPTAPPISDTLKAQFWKAQAEFQASTTASEKAQQDLQQKQAALTAVVGLIQTACGEKFQPTMDKDQNPVCRPKPKPEAAKIEPPKPAEKK